jgi:hypothetical protein
MTYVTPLELAYRTISRPSPPPQKTVEANVKVKAPSELTRADVDLILQRKRDAAVAELQYILDNHRQFHLSDGQRNQISTDLTITAAAARARAERRSDDNSQFMLHKLGYAETPWGLLANRAFYEKVFKDGAGAIARCSNHKPPKCECWRNVRDALWGIQSHYGAKSPEAFAATRIYSSLEELEVAARSEPIQQRTPPPTVTFPWSKRPLVRRDDMD